MMPEEDYRTQSDGLVCCVCGSDDCICEEEMCPDCNGQGFFVDCIDDLCYGGESCLHGDGETHCQTCDGDGFVLPARITQEEYDIKNKKEPRN